MRLLFTALTLGLCTWPSIVFGQAQLAPDGTTSGMLALGSSRLPDGELRHGLVASVAPLGRFDLWAGLISTEQRGDASMAAGIRVLLVRSVMSRPLSIHTGYYGAGNDRRTRRGLELGVSALVNVSPRVTLVPQLSLSHERGTRRESPSPLAISSIPVDRSTPASLVAWSYAVTARVRLAGQFHLAVSPGLRTDSSGRTVGLEVGLLQFGHR